MSKILEMNAIHKYYGDFHALNDCSLDVELGSTIVVVGPSGSGKSTLLRCINSLEFIDGGSIVFDGKEVSKERSRAFVHRRMIGMVFQNFELFPHLSIIDNIVLGPTKILGVDKAVAMDEARALLERVKIPSKANDYPENLSGGQQQRVAIARALAMKPRLMLYDEPTSALDPEMIKEVIDVMTELSEGGMTSVVVTHEMGFARRAADRVVFMEEGRIIENAPTEEFFSSTAHPRTRLFLQQILH